MMIQHQNNGLRFFQFPNLRDVSGIHHGIFTRNGGVSQAPYQSLNVGRGNGDSEENVSRNRALILKAMGGNSLSFARQIHGTDIRILSKEKTGSPPSFSDAPRRQNSPASADAIITDIPGHNIVIQVADCQAVLLYDPARRVVANIHSGWRGSIRNIIGKTVCAMEDHFGSVPRQLLAGIGPSLGPCCAEFVNYQQEIPEYYWKYKDESHYFDFWAISRDQLCAAGVPVRNICVSRLCTKCRTDLFFSYRGETRTGRFAAVIGIR